MPQKKIYEQAELIYTEYVAKNKLRKSPERNAILEHIYMTDERFTAEELHGAMSWVLKVSLATVYNTLDLFVKANLVVRHDFGPNAMVYEKAVGRVAQHFMICSKCGAVREFTDRHVKAIVEAKRFSNFTMKNYSIYLYGHCRKCKKKKSSKIN